MTTIQNKQIVEGKLTSFEWSIGSARGRITIPYEHQIEEDAADIAYYEALIDPVASLEDCKKLALNEAPIDPLAAAEAHIAEHFSTARLLQLKLWWDEMSHNEAPKLMATYEWIDAITVSAAGGATVFPAPPHTFEELVVECVAMQQQ